MGGLRSQYGYRFIVGLCLVLVTFAAFRQVLGNEFVFDDRPYVLDNRHVHSGLTLEAVKWAFASGHAANWHPVTWLSHMVDCQIFGLNPVGHHLTNLLFHILNSVILFLLLVRMTGYMWRSAFVAALFALHPLHVESVAWVAERKDMVSTFFLVLTIWAYVRYVERPGTARYVPVLLFFVLGLMSKPMLVTLPFVLLLLDYWPLGRLRLGESAGRDKSRTKRTDVGAAIWEKVPLFALSAASSMVTYLVQQASGAMGESGAAMPFGIRLANAVVSYVSYVLKMLWPTDLAVLYPHPVRGLPAWQLVGAALLLAGITVLVLRASRKQPYLGLGWLWYVGTLVPVIGLVQVGAQAMADRYTYVPFIGLFLMIGWGVPDLVAGSRTGVRVADAGTRARGDRAAPESHRSLFLSPGRLVLPTLATATIGALAVATWFQVAHWQNSLTLFGQALRVTDGNYLAHNNYGAALEDAGRMDEAAAHYREALRARPNYVDALNNVGNALRTQGEHREAELNYRKALEISSGNAKAHGSLGAVLEAQGKIDEAIAEYREALRINPGMAGVRSDLAKALSSKGRKGQAVREMLEAIRTNPRCLEAHYNLAIEFTEQGKVQEAADHYARVLALDPNHMSAHLNLGALMADQGKHAEAISHYLEVVRINPRYAPAHSNLAVSFFLKGDYARAWEHVRLCRKYGLEPDPRLVRDLAARMPQPD